MPEAKAQKYFEAASDPKRSETYADAHQLFLKDDAAARLEWLATELGQLG